MLKTLHGVSFSRTSLSIRKNCDCTSVEYKVKDWSYATIIEFIIALLLAKSVVKLKLLVLNKFCYTVHFKLVFMDNYKWVTLFLKYGPLINAHANLQLVSGNVLNKN